MHPKMQTCIYLPKFVQTQRKSNTREYYKQCVWKKIEWALLLIFTKGKTKTCVVAFVFIVEITCLRLFTLRLRDNDFYILCVLNRYWFRHSRNWRHSPIVTWHLWINFTQREIIAFYIHTFWKKKDRYYMSILFVANKVFLIF